MDQVFSNVKMRSKPGMTPTLWWWGVVALSSGTPTPTLTPPPAALFSLLEQQTGDRPSFFWTSPKRRLFEIVSNCWCFWSRWVVFALSPKLEAFHESILSYQCVCRGEEREHSNSFDTRLWWKSLERTCIEHDLYHLLRQNVVFRCTSWPYPAQLDQLILSSK